MRRPLLAATTAAIVAAALGAIPLGAIGQQGAAPVDPALLQQGAQLFSDNCASCHQPNGTGLPPDFPALAGNQRLEDLALIVGNVHNGKNAMPAFPELTAEQIAAVASYVRNSWGNNFGVATADQITAALATLPKAGAATAAKTIWDGVFTAAQTERALTVYSGACAKCHGDRLNGAAQPDQPTSPAIARASFLSKWGGQTLLPLYEYIHIKMPLDNPGQLTEQQAADVLAYMLSVSGAQPGDVELPTDTAQLGQIAIVEKPK